MDRKIKKCSFRKYEKPPIECYYCEVIRTAGVVAMIFVNVLTLLFVSGVL